MAAAPGAAFLPQVQLDDSTYGTRIRIRVRNAAGSAALPVGCVSAGVAADTAAIGNMAPGTPFRAGLTLDVVGRVAAA